MDTELFCSLCHTPNIKEYIFLQNEAGDTNEIYEITAKYFNSKLLLERRQPQSSKKRSVMCHKCWVHIRDFYNFQQTTIKTRTSLMDDKVDEIPDISVLCNHNNRNDGILALLEDNSEDDLLMEEEEFQFTSDFCTDSNNEPKENINNADKKMDTGIFNNDDSYIRSVIQTSIDETSIAKPLLNSKVDEFQYTSDSNTKYTYGSGETKNLQNTTVQNSPLHVMRECHTSSHLNKYSIVLDIPHSEEKSSMQENIEIFMKGTKPMQTDTKEEQFQFTSCDSNEEIGENVNCIEMEMSTGVCNNADIDLSCNLTEASVKQHSLLKPWLHSEIEKKFQFTSASNDKYNSDSDGNKIVQQLIISKSPLHIKDYLSSSILNEDSNNSVHNIYDSNYNSNIQMDIDIFSNATTSSNICSSNPTSVLSDTKTTSFSTINNTTFENVPDSTPGKEYFTHNNPTAVEQDISFNIYIQERSKIYNVGVLDQISEQKKHFCIFCKSLQSRLVDHFTLSHKSEKQIMKAMLLPRRSKERLKIMETLQKEGDFLYNASKELQQNSHKSPISIHKLANDKLRNIILRTFKDENVTRVIRNDELIIKYGNKLTLNHRYDTIKTELRLLGKFLIEVKTTDCSIRQLKDIYKPSLFNTCVGALRKLSQWDDSLQSFRAPATANRLTHLIVRCSKIQKGEFIKTQSDEAVKAMQHFLELWDENKRTIHMKALDQCFPSKSDIKKLYVLLKNKIVDAIASLDKEFNLKCWNDLVEAALTFTYISSGCSAWIIESLKMESYSKKITITEGGDIWGSLSKDSKAFVKHFFQLTVPSKIGGTVNVLLSPLCIKAINQIIKYRSEAGISTKHNQFIFLKRTESKHCSSYYTVRLALKKFWTECSFEMPDKLSSPKLRKHIANHVTLFQLEDATIENPEDFVGDHKEVHKRIYAVPIPVTEVTCVSTLLMSVIGNAVEETATSTDNNTTTVEQDLTVQEESSEISKMGTLLEFSKAKREFCKFCKSFTLGLEEHFISNHKFEKQIEEAMKYPPGSKQRLYIFDTLKKEGDLLFITSKECNSKQQIVIAPDPINVHELANDISKAIIIRLMDDDVTSVIRYDELIIKYANTQTSTCGRYIIKQRLRLLGRFLVEVKANDDSITQLKYIYKPSLFDTCIRAVRKNANWDDNLQWFRYPAVARSLYKMITSCGKIQKYEFLNSHSYESIEDIENFLELWDENIRAANKKGLGRWANIFTLPSRSDIKKFYVLLKKKIFDGIAALDKEFDLRCWIDLVEATLVFTQILNGSAGNLIARLKMKSYSNKNTITQNGEIWQSLSKESKAFLKQFFQLTELGKMGETVNVLLNPLSIKAIDIIIKYRTDVGLCEYNERIFVKITQTIHFKRYEGVGPLLKKFSAECGVEMPDSLKQPKLRKHIAKYATLFYVEDATIDEREDHKELYESIFAVPIPVAEVSCVWAHLLSEMAIGHDNNWIL